MFEVMTVSLNVSKRETAKKPDLHAHVIGIVYGPKQDPVPVTIDRSEFERLYKEAGESTIITLTGLDESIEVLVQDTAFDPVKGIMQHVDFYAIERGKELTANIPLTFIGTPPAEDQDGVLTKVLHEIEVTCRPSDLPHDIEVDVSGMANIDDQIKVKDIQLPSGVKVENDPEDVVALISGAREEEEETTEAVDMDAVEVEEKGKKEDGESANDSE